MTEEQLLERYLANDLTPAQRQALEKRLANDTALRHELALRQEVEQLAVRDDLTHIFNLAGKAMAERPTQGAAVRRLWPRLVAVAAVLVFMIGITLYINNNQGFANHKEVFTAYYKPYPAYQTVRGSQSKQNGFYLGMEAYQQGAYKNALAAFDTASHINTNIILFYQAQCHLYLGKGQLAVQLLEQVAAQQTGLLAEQAQWYLALAQLQTGNLALARQQFMALAAKTGTYQQQADNIVKAIDKMAQ